MSVLITDDGRAVTKGLLALQAEVTARTAALAALSQSSGIYLTEATLLGTAQQNLVYACMSAGRLDAGEIIESFLSLGLQYGWGLVPAPGSNPPGTYYFPNGPAVYFYPGTEPLPADLVQEWGPLPPLRSIAANVALQLQIDTLEELQVENPLTDYTEQIQDLQKQIVTNTLANGNSNVTAAAILGGMT